MKISASVYSNKTKTVEELAKDLDAVHVDYIHIDCNDNLAVFDDIKKIREVSRTPIDLHIISSEPEKFFEGIRDTQTDLVTFQYENLSKPLVVPADIKAKLGLAIVSETSSEVFDSYSNTFDFILFMTTTPGKSGGIFNKDNFKKIREFKTKYPGKKIHVDGGVNDEISFVLRNMGVYSVVSGSYLVNPNDSIGRALHRLRSDNVESHTLVSDFMLNKNELPVIHPKAGLQEILQSIENYNLGFTSVVDEKGRLLGIISNADVRRGLLKNMNKINDIAVAELINKNPFKIYSSYTVSEMLNFIKNLKATILFLPVVDENETLQGAVIFNNLIKGE